MGVEVGVTRPEPGKLELTYVVNGAISELYIPAPAAPARVDELWRRTCFEAFVAAGPGQAYFEFNFAPSSEWAAYGFSGYRAGMGVADKAIPPRIEVHTTDHRCELRVALALDGLLTSDRPWRLGLSAVIEDAGGARSYWALAHPPGQADFHHPSSFTCELPSLEIS
jgi:hypothetical protein